MIPHLILEKLQGVEFDCIGGLVMGAVPLLVPFTMVARADYGRDIPGFFVRQQPKDHGTKSLIEGCDVRGKKAVVLDDVTTTGGSAMQAVDAVLAADGEVVAVLSIEEGAVDFYAERGIPFYFLFSASEFRAKRGAA
jgi:orotate phosphoribosyltransferase